MRVKIFNSRDDRGNSTAEDRIHSMENSLNHFLLSNQHIAVKHITTQPIDKDLSIVILYD